MSSPTCREVREFLASVSSGRPTEPSDLVWEALSAHGAIQGSRSAPAITPVGAHVLSELQVRAGRTDPLTLERVAGQLSRLLEELDSVAKTAEYFLAELGALTPPLAQPLLRPVSIGLANRRETPEEMATEFRSVWGGVEVMGGDPRDRLLAAELLNASSASMEKLYSPIMNSTGMIRQRLGGLVPAVTPAAILHLMAGPDTPIALDAYFAVRESAGSDEAAALLVGVAPKDAKGAVTRRDAIAARLGKTASPDARHAATYLIASGSAPELTDRTVVLAKALGSRITDPLTSAAVLSGLTHLPPEEIVNWVDKAIEILTTRQLAPTTREIAALAVGLVHGLPESEFLSPTAFTGTYAAAPMSIPALTALHAWIYRPLLGFADSFASAPAAG